ncbi:MAG: 6-phosphogluconolactonase [Pseudomonadota bacterium]
MKFIEYPDRNALFDGLATQVSATLEAALEADAETAAATLAVPGGTTPAPFFERLRERPLRWQRVRVMLTDERRVALDDDRSNIRLVRETLLRGRAAAAQEVTMSAETQNHDAAAKEVAARVARALPLDICVLGMGADMHTASLFPGAARLSAALAPDAPPVLAIEAPGAPEPRLTLSATVLAGAGAVHLLITGAEKRAALDRALADGPVEEAPVRAVLPHATVHWAL